MPSVRLLLVCLRLGGASPGGTVFQFCLRYPPGGNLLRYWEAFFDREIWERAVYWYTRALECERHDDRGGFVLPDAYGFLPCIQLCVCYSKLGRQEDAQFYNELNRGCKIDTLLLFQMEKEKLIF